MFVGRRGDVPHVHLPCLCCEDRHSDTFYRSHANGVLEFVDGDYRFTRIVIFPTIVVALGDSKTKCIRLLREDGDIAL